MPFKRLDVADQWKVLGGDDNVNANGRALKIKSFAKNNRMAYVTGTPDGGPSDVGVLRLSADYGLSWADAAVPAACDGCLDVDQAPNGDLWGLFYDSTTPGDPDGYTAKVAVSTNNGASWSVKFELDPGLQAFNIAVRPRPGTQQIAFLARDAQGAPGDLGTTYNLFVSVNAGTDWTSYPTYLSAEDLTDVPLLSWSGTGRLLIFSPGDFIDPILAPFGSGSTLSFSCSS